MRVMKFKWMATAILLWSLPHVRLWEMERGLGSTLQGAENTPGQTAWQIINLPRFLDICFLSCTFRDEYTHTNILHIYTYKYIHICIHKP